MKLSVRKNRQGFMMERHSKDGLIDIKITCVDSSATVNSTFDGLSSEMADRVTSIFENATSANEVKTKLETLRLF